MKINVYEFNFIIIIAPNVIIAPINTKVNKKEEKLIINYKSLNIISNNQDNIIISHLYKNINIFFWSYLHESNMGMSDLQSDALPLSKGSLFQKGVINLLSFFISFKISS